MPFRFFVPLPGPFVWVPKGRGQRRAESDARTQRGREYLDSLTVEQQWRRGAAIVVCFWALLAYVAFFYGYWQVGIGIIGVGLLHLRSGFEKEQQRRVAVEAEYERLRAERNDGQGSS